MIITIKDKKTTAVIDSYGAQLISLKDSTGKEYMWQRDPDIWSKCSPLLFPIIGNLRDEKTKIDGIWYEIPKHGFCKETDFEVKEHTDACAAFQMTDSELTKTMYPYAFRLTLTYSLKDGVLSMDCQVENSDDQTIYYCIGTHPGFQCPLGDGEIFEDYVLEFEQVETASALIYDSAALQFDCKKRVKTLENSHTIPLSYSLFDRDALYLDTVASRTVSLLHPVTRHGIEVSYPDFDTVAFWTPTGKKAPFLCIEPWNGSAVHSDEDDEFIHKNGLQTLAPGEIKNYHLGIRIL